MSGVGVCLRSGLASSVDQSPVVLRRREEKCRFRLGDARIPGLDLDLSHPWIVLGFTFFPPLWAVGPVEILFAAVFHYGLDPVPA